MRFLVASLAALSLLCAQSAPPKPAPKKVDAALRARVTEFHQYLLAGTFRQAYDMVAKDSQDYFLSTSKQKPTVFKIEQIEYSDKFRKAVVKVSTTNHQLVGFHVIDLPTMVIDYWKLERGKWMWYHDPAADRPNFFGLPIGDAAAKPESALAKAIPKDTSPEAMAAAAQAALKGAADKPVLDKDSLEFVLGTAGEQQVVVHNDYKGEVHLAVSLPGESVGLSVEPAQATLKALGDVAVTIRYLPLYRTPASAAVTFQLQPFPKIYSLPVKIVAPAADAADAAKQ